MKRKLVARPALTLMELVMVLVILVALAGILVPLVGTTTMDAQNTATNATLKTLRDAVVAYNQDMKGPAAWVGSPSPPPGAGVPITLKDLQIQPAGSLAFNPVTRQGWRGPYLLQATGAFPLGLDSSFYPANAFFPAGNGYGNPNPPADPAFLDSWGNPIILQWPKSQTGDSVSALAPFVRLISAGPPTRVTVNGKASLQAILSTPADTIGNAAPYQYIPTTAQRGTNIVLFVFTQDPYIQKPIQP